MFLIDKNGLITADQALELKIDVLINMESLDKLSKEELETLKLREELQYLRKPLWKKPTYISMFIAFLIGVGGMYLTIWQTGIQVDIIQLEKREKDLAKSVATNTNVLRGLSEKSKYYKVGFIKGFMSENDSVQRDISRYIRDDRRPEAEQWLKEKFLWTALTRYEKYIIEQLKQDPLYKTLKITD